MKKSILWTLVLPVPIVVIVVLIGFFLIVPDAIQSRAEHQAIQTAKQTVAQFKTVRGYYTKNVVA